MTKVTDENMHQDEDNPFNDDAVSKAGAATPAWATVDVNSTFAPPVSAAEAEAAAAAAAASDGEVGVSDAPAPPPRLVEERILCLWRSSSYLDHHHHPSGS